MHRDVGDQGRRRFLTILLGAPAAFAFGLRLFGRDEAALADTLLAASSPGGAGRPGRTLAPTPTVGTTTSRPPP
jgi:hypothetical protein